MAKRPSKSIITPKHYQSIGEIIVTWARLESHMLQTFRALLGLSKQQTLAVFWEMQFRNRLTRLRTLSSIRFKGKDPSQQKEFTALLNEIDSAYFVRVLAAHAVWHKGKTRGSITPLFLNAKGNCLKRTHPQFQELRDRDFTAARLHKEALKAQRLAERFKKFSADNFGAQFLHTKGEDSLH